jgi:hypothetical protein
LTKPPSRTAFKIALDSIHCANCLLPNLTRENLMLREESMGIVIVGLGDAWPTTSHHVKMKELQKLLLILPNSLKRTRGGNHTWSFLDIHPSAGLSRF